MLCRVPGSRGLLPGRRAGLPLLGAIAAGAPLDLFDAGDVDFLELETLTRALPGIWQSPKQDIFALRVQGDSLIEDGILDGEYAFIAASPTVAQGAIAVALHRSANGGHGEVTLKHVDVEADAVRLRPANPAYPVRVIAREEWDREWSVQGALIEVRRRYS
jgi:repressor LexA